MKELITIENELRDMSPVLAEIPKNNVFSVPDGYFNELPDRMLSITESKVFRPLVPVQPFNDVPSGYFEHLSDNILQKVKSGSVAPNMPETTSDILAPVRHMNVFEIPAGYFDQLATSILKKVTSGNTGKLVPFNSRKRIIQFAAAAMITGLIALGIYSVNNHQVINGTNSALTAATLDPSIESGKKMNDQEFTDKMNNLSEDDIAKYIEKNGDETDLAALSSGIEENNLPQQEEYLTDEKTLENYLNDLEEKNANN